MHFDTHAHVHFAAYGAETGDVIKRSLEAGVWMTNIGTSLATSKAAVDLAGRYPEGVYAAVGLHPGHTWHDEKDEEESTDNKQESFDPDAFAAIITGKVVAVGEIGLDYYRLPEDAAEAAAAKAIQKREFIRQLKFAQERKLPTVIHCRDAYEDTLEILRSEYQGAGILHSFTADWETAKRFLDLGFYVALNGILTFDKTGRLAEVCKSLPSDRILSETDSPYLAPAPYRGKRNEPLYVREVVSHMATLRGVPQGEMAEILFRNALAAYGLPGK